MPLTRLLIILEAAFAESSEHAFQELADNPEHQQYDYNISHVLSYLNVYTSFLYYSLLFLPVLFSLDTRAAGSAAIELHPVFVEYPKYRTFAVEAAGRPNVIE